MNRLLEHVRFCIFGAGPSGLSFARELMRNGIDSFIVLESEKEAGGLCRSEVVDGSPLDIGGGHFLEVERKTVLDFLFELMPESEWNRFHRIARIRIRNREIDHPLEANLWQFKIEDQLDFLESISKAGCVRGAPEPERFDDWIRWKLGDLISEEYMIPYNDKIWSIPLKDIGNYWLHKLPSVSFRETIRSCLKKKPGGTLPAHRNFLYPKVHGYGEVWRRMGCELGDRLRLGCAVTSIDADRKIVNKAIKADMIVSTIPWVSWLEINALPQTLHSAVGDLQYSSVDIDYHTARVDSPAHWVYEPSHEVPHHRLLLRHNFCCGARGHWTETNAKRSASAAGFRHRNVFAYPINTIGKRRVLDGILSWAGSRNILPLGRWGLWEHMNSDVAVERAIEAAQYVAGQ
jgi:protoporphyrinogen oxidase